MKHQRITIVVIVSLCIAVAGTASAQPSKPNVPSATVGTAFTYQGQIERDGALFTGTCDMQFSLWNAAVAGTQQGATLSVSAVNVDNGVFAVELDFGNQFTGSARWLETSAMCADDVDFTTLPRIALNPALYAVSLIPGAVIEGSVDGAATNQSASGNSVTAVPKGTVTGKNTGTGAGVVGTAISGVGVWGSSTTWHGVHGESRDSVGVFGNSEKYDGVWGQSIADYSAGVVGVGKDPCAFVGCSPGAYLRNAMGVYGVGEYGGYGLLGRSAMGVSVAGFSTGYDQPDLNSLGFGTPAAMFGGPNGVIGYSKATGGNGVSGVALTPGSVGVAGYSNGTGYAAYFHGKTATKILEIQGGGDLAELFDVSHDKAEPGTLMIIDTANPGHLAISRSAYDTKVAGIVSGAGDVRPGLILHQEGVMEGDTQVAIAGRVYVKATSSNGSIEPGDLLTTSDVPGYAMKATDHDRSQGAVIGKAMTTLDKGDGLVLVLVNLQ